jgi:hypothetical protein
MRDERKRQYPPAIREAREAESAYTAARTVALIFSHASGAVSIGSATGIRLGSYYFWATAAHNINARDQPTRTEVVPYPYKASNQKATIVSRSHPRSAAYDHDAAWLQVSPEFAETLGITWLCSKDLLCGQRFDPYHAFFIQGFPASEVIQGPRGLDPSH